MTNPLLSESEARVMMAKAYRQQSLISEAEDILDVGGPVSKADRASLDAIQSAAAEGAKRMQEKAVATVRSMRGSYNADIAHAIETLTQPAGVEVFTDDNGIEHHGPAPDAGSGCKWCDAGVERELAPSGKYVHWVQSKLSDELRRIATCTRKPASAPGEKADWTACARCKKPEVCRDDGCVYPAPPKEAPERKPQSPLAEVLVVLVEVWKAHSQHCKNDDDPVTYSDMDQILSNVADRLDKRKGK